MVRLAAVSLLFTLQAWALHPLIEAKIAALLEPSDMKRHAKLIELVFQNESAYFIDGTIQTIEIIKTLKANGLLELFFQTPQTIQVTFTTGGNAQFFIKLLRDTLRSIGYYRYFTTTAKRDVHGFTWNIEFISEYAIDPIVLQEALYKRNCLITQIDRYSKTTWHYTIDIENAHLSLEQLAIDQPTTLKKSLRPYWIDVSNGQKLSIFALKGDAWFPDIAIFDEKMRLLKIYKRKEQAKEVVFYLPKESMYMKIADVFNQSNIRNGLKLLLEGEK